MRTLAEGQRVIVKKVDSTERADGVVINAPGVVVRVRTDGAAWIRLDKRLVDGVHSFPKNDKRGRDVVAEPGDCEPEVGKGANGNRRSRRRNEKLVEEGKLVVTVEQFGKDHWSTFAYLCHRAIDNSGRIDHRKMRCDAKRHPFLAHEASVWSQKEYPTRLKVGELHDHDDWDCMDDLESHGFLMNIGTAANPVVRLTPLGLETWKQLSSHKQAGGNFAAFNPVLAPATAEGISA